MPLSAGEVGLWCRLLRLVCHSYTSNCRGSTLPFLKDSVRMNVLSWLRRGYLSLSSAPPSTPSAFRGPTHWSAGITGRCPKRPSKWSSRQLG
jgi:hypothetical protein